MDAETYRKDIERKILAVIDQQLRTGKMTAPTAQQIAQYMLSIFHPNMTLDEIHKALPSLISKFPEFIAAITPYINTHNDKMKQYVNEHVILLTQEGKIEEAITLVKKALENDLPIE